MANVTYDNLLSYVKDKIYIIEEISDNIEFHTLIKKRLKAARNGNPKERLQFIEYIYTLLNEEIQLEDNEPIYLKDYIDILVSLEKLNVMEKFELLLLLNLSIDEKTGYENGFNVIRKKYDYKKESEDGQNIYYEYTSDDIEKIFNSETNSSNISSDIKFKFLARKIYAESYGLLSIDTLAYSSINEVGINNDGKYIFAWDEDKIHLSFMKISEVETRKIQERSIAFDEKAGALNSGNPEVLCYRYDNARVTALQAPYSSARTLRIRIFNKQKNSFKDIVTDKTQQVLLKTIIKSGQTLCLQGGLGTGKTTAMEVLLEVLDDKLHIGTVEDYFEQNNMKKYPNKGIVELQELKEKDILTSVKSLFRLSVDIANVGEARDGNAVFAFIQLAQAIPGAAMFTTHIARPEDTVPRLKNMLITTNNYTNENSAIIDIVEYVNIIVQHEIIDNKRRISKIVEIIPQKVDVQEINISMETEIEKLYKLKTILDIQSNPRFLYKLNTLLEFQDNEYRVINKPSNYFMNKVKSNCSSDEINEFNNYFCERT